jgi:F-type H+-transporting ATPase subunit epsilon
MSILQFELVSPEKLLFSKPVALVTVPGTEGDFGVLPGHAPMVTTVKAGVIEIYAEENAAPTDRIFVAGGFAEVTQTRCTVLADEATPVKELNRATLEHTASALAAKLAYAGEADRDALLAEQAVLSAKIQAAA